MGQDDRSRGKALGAMRGKVFVTGATGLMGKPIVKRLISKGYSVRVFARNLCILHTLHIKTMHGVSAY